MTAPNFIGIGAQKCASTWLYEILLDHPDVCLSDPKELDFFSYAFHNGWQWYHRHFHCAAGTKAIGEISPSYFHEPAVPERVKRHLPQARILLSLRDPVQRALSNHKHEVRVGNFRGEDLSFEAGLRNNPSYLEQGMYATHLSRWLEHFPRHQIMIVIYDDILSDPVAVARSVFEFLQIDPQHVPAAMHQRSNASYIDRYRFLNAARKATKQTLQRMGLGSFWQLVSTSPMKAVYEKVNKRASDAVIPPISGETLTVLRGEFVGEIDRLEKMLGRELTSWH